MAELKSMKLTKKEKKQEETISTRKEDFPFGLSIHLDDESLEKLGINANSMPSVGTKMMLLARVEVRSMSIHEDDGDDVRRSISLQITDMALDPEKKKKSAGEVLFGGE